MSPSGGRRVFEIRGEKSGHVHSYGARWSRSEAEEFLTQWVARVREAGGSNSRYWIEEIDAEGLFEFPSRPAPRERFSYREVESRLPGRWTTCHVEVLDGDRVIYEYDRDYSMLQTFEPFRQGDRLYALISPNYTATSVVDLSDGTIVAAEEPDSGGFCPVGFYVPDWWDLHGGGKLPGTLNWRPQDDEWPTGDFGFVWGCVWGDDSSWKIQYLDLSRLSEGVLARDERFGYLKLATDPKLSPRHFIKCSSRQGERRVQFYLEKGFSLGSGLAIPGDDW